MSDWHKSGPPGLQRAPSVPQGAIVSKPYDPLTPRARQGGAYQPSPAARPRDAITPPPHDRVGPEINGESESRASPAPEQIALDPRNWWSPQQPVTPFGPWLGPVEWDYPVGINLDFSPARVSFFAQLRAMAQSWGILATVIQTRIDQIMRIPWSIQLREKPKATNKRTEEIRDFFRRPDQKNGWEIWARMMLYDMLVIDAPALYIWRALSGKPLAIEVLDGATIKPLIDDSGRRPDYPNPAFQQVRKGLPLINFDETELLYTPMRPRPQMPIYGYPPTEQILIEISAGVRKALYVAGFWSEGTMPELIMTVPDTWTPEQTATFQAHFDALMAGNYLLKSRVRFFPGGMKPFDIRNANGDALKAEWDEWLARIVCFAYSTSPQPFIRSMNRATAESASQQAEEEGLYPLMNWLKTQIMDRLIQDPQIGFGYDDAEFGWLPNPEVDQLKRAQIHQIYLNAGVVTRNEVREELGNEPMADGDELTVANGNNVATLDMIVSGAAMQPPNGGAGGGQTMPDRSQGARKPQNDLPAAKPGVGKARREPFRLGREADRGARASEGFDAPSHHRHSSYVRDGLEEAKGARPRKTAKGYGAGAC
jgi:hypothetical protein